MSAAGEPWLRAVGLTKTFNGVTAIGGADLSLRAGEVRGVVGPNGAGKSTLMQMIAGIHPVDDGELLVDGEPVRLRGPEDALDAGIALVPQEMQLAPHLSVAGNIVMGREPRRLGLVSPTRSREIAARALTRLDAQIDPDQTVLGLSAVERRLVMVARALVTDARLIILDEPTAALAPHEATAVLSMVSSLAATGVSFLYVSHRFDDIEAVATSVTGIRDARVVAELARDEITHARLVDLVTPVDVDADQAAAPVTRRAGREGGVGGDEVLVVGDLGGGPLERFSVTVRAGEVVGVVGLAGSGVDHAIRMVGGIDAHTVGTVSVRGRTLSSGDRLAAVRAGVAYVPGDRGLATFANHSVTANITVASLSEVSRRGVVSRAVERRRARALAERVDLAGVLTGALSSLSGGNQQKAIFARWIATEASVLLLHDPTAGVDVGARAEIHDRVRELAAEGQAVLVVTTDLAELVELADRVLVLDRGRLVGELAGDDVAESSLLAAMTGGLPSTVSS